MKKNILFVGHDANRAGSQILLLRFLKLLKNHPDFEFTVLLKHGGELLEEYKKVTDTFIFYNESGATGILAKIKSRFSEKKQVTDQLITRKFDLIVSNTLTNGDIFDSLTAFGCPIFTYVHELEMGIRMYTYPEHFQKVLQNTGLFIACAQSVSLNLINKHGISANKIEVLPSLLPEVAISYQKNPQNTAYIKRELGIPETAFLVGGMGTVDIRKGVDIFLKIAQKLEQEDIWFLWVGGNKNQPEFQIFKIDIERLGLKKILFQESVSNALDYISAFDIFLLSSREDPYPLVVLEAALLEKPIICFDQAGGAKDLIGEDGGFVIDYLDADKMAEKVLYLKANPEICRQFGASSRKKVLTLHNQDRAFQKFTDILNTNVKSD